MGVSWTGSAGATLRSPVPEFADPLAALLIDLTHALLAPASVMTLVAGRNGAFVVGLIDDVIMPVVLVCHARVRGARVSLAVLGVLR